MAIMHGNKHALLVSMGHITGTSRHAHTEALMGRGKMVAWTSTAWSTRG